jgi:hypothetical protein
MLINGPKYSKKHETKLILGRLPIVSKTNLALVDVEISDVDSIQRSELS